MKATVFKEFHDAFDITKIYKVGEDVSGFEEGRLQRLITLGYVRMEAVDVPVAETRKGRLSGKNGNDPPAEMPTEDERKPEVTSAGDEAVEEITQSGEMQ
jgi:hypothetical protein